VSLHSPLVPHARYANAHADCAHTYGRQAIEIVLLSISSLLLSTPAIPLHTVEEVYTEKAKQSKRDRATERGEQESAKELEREREEESDRERERERERELDECGKRRLACSLWCVQRASLERASLDGTLERNSLSLLSHSLSLSLSSLPLLSLPPHLSQTRAAFPPPPLPPPLSLAPFCGPRRASMHKRLRLLRQSWQRTGAVLSGP
jgi:hypothetical protein